MDANIDDVYGTARALGQAVREAYGKLHRTEAFHRLAMPYFVDDTLHVNPHPMGQLVTEMLAAELAKEPPFVVLDRSRLTEIMGQNHLTDLYRIDTPSAVAFGRLLGAQTILAGAVEDGGDNSYSVHLRQVDVQTGKVLLDSHAVMGREALDGAASAAVVQRTIKDAMWRSALFPGVGQLYLQEPYKGGAFATVAAASLGTAVGFYLAAAVARSEYLQNKASTVGDRATANDRLVGGNVSLAVYAAVWLINLVDVYMTPPPAPEIRIPD